MPNREYEAGRRLEYEVVHYLTDSGYLAFRSPGSKGAADIIAMKSVPGGGGISDLLFVQCKKDGYIPPAERHALTVLAEQFGARSLVVGWSKPNPRAARRLSFVSYVIDHEGRCVVGDVWTADYGMEVTP